MKKLMKFPWFWWFWANITWTFSILFGNCFFNGVHAFRRSSDGSSDGNSCTRGQPNTKRNKTSDKKHDFGLNVEQKTWFWRAALLTISYWKSHLVVHQPKMFVRKSFRQPCCRLNWHGSLMSSVGNSLSSTHRKAFSLKHSAVGHVLDVQRLAVAPVLRIQCLTFSL